MLASYQTDTQNLLQTPQANSNPLYPLANITRWINISRGQLAGESECIRFSATISTVIGQREYLFSALNTGVAASNGIAGALHVSSIKYAVGEGNRWIAPRGWPWFNLYGLNNAIQTPGVPQMWAQFAQGAAGTDTGSGASGSFSIHPLPDAVYTLTCDCVCYPIPLVDDTTVEAIPYLWTDAVPFFAAARALMASQTQARLADAQRYMEVYKDYVDRARGAANPTVQRHQYRQGADPVQAVKLGVKGGA